MQPMRMSVIECINKISSSLLSELVDANPVGFSRKVIDGSDVRKMCLERAMLVGMDGVLLLMEKSRLIEMIECFEKKDIKERSEMRNEIRNEFCRVGVDQFLEKLKINVLQNICKILNVSPVENKKSMIQNIKTEIVKFGMKKMLNKMNTEYLKELAHELKISPVSEKKKLINQILGKQQQYLFEVCVDSCESAIIAEQAGASRVELCSALSEGGLTPSFGLISEVKKHVKIPVFVIIRPRAGDFLYSDTEFEIMKSDIDVCKKLKCEGVVLGILNKDGTVDKKRTRELVQLARPLQVTFHRAFDMTKDLLQALEDVIELGCERILTSGGEQSVLEGLPMLEKLVKQAANRIIIMPGGGVSQQNIQRIVQCGAKEYHLSGRKTVESEMVYRNYNCFMGGSLRESEFVRKVSSKEKLTAVFNNAQC